jgi:hypothetical protein
MDALRIYEEQTLRRIEMSNLQTVQTSCSQNFDPSGFISADGAGASTPDLEAAAQYAHVTRGHRRPLFIEHNSPMLQVCECYSASGMLSCVPRLLAQLTLWHGFTLT